MVDALPGDVGDVQQAVDAAEIDESAVIGDVLHHPVHHLALDQVLHQLGALLGPRLLHDGAAGHDDVAAAAVHLQDLEGLRQVHQGTDIADRPDVDLAAGQEGDGAAEIDGEATLDAAENDPVDALVLLERFFETDPGFFAAGLVAGDDGLAHGILDALEIDLDLVADLQPAVAPGALELPQRHPPLGLQSDIDDGQIVLDRHHLALHDRAFGGRRFVEGGIEHRREVVARGVVGASLRHSPLLSQIWLARGYLRRTSRCSAPGRWAGKRRCVGLSMGGSWSEGATDQARCIPLQNRWGTPRQTRRSP